VFISAPSLPRAGLIFLPKVVREELIAGVQVALFNLAGLDCENPRIFSIKKIPSICEKALIIYTGRVFGLFDDLADYLMVAFAGVNIALELNRRGYNFFGHFPIFLYTSLNLSRAPRPS